MEKQYYCPSVRNEVIKIHDVLFIGRAQYFFLKNLIKYSEEGRAPFLDVSDQFLTVQCVILLCLLGRFHFHFGARSSAADAVVQGGAGAGAGAQLNLPQFCPGSRP